MEEVKLDYSKVVKRIWFHPVSTLNYVLNLEDRFSVYRLLFLVSIAYGMYKKINENNLENEFITHIFSINILVGGFVGLISIYIFTSLLSFTGEFLGGEASGAKYRSVLAWSSIPAIFAVTLLIPAYFVFGEEVFKGFLGNYKTSFYSTLCYIFFGIYYLLNFWSLVIFVLGIQLIQKFSIFKAIGNLFLPSITFAICIFLIFGLISIGS